MTEHPLLLNDEMVRALQSGRKTQTRRPVVSIGDFGRITEVEPSDTPGYDWTFRDKRMLWNDISNETLMAGSPFGKPGDQLWIREAFTVESNRGIDQYPPPHNDGRPIRRGSDEDQGEWWEQCHYRATDAEPELDYEDGDGFDPKCKWTPSIHMPRWASRYSVTVKRMWCERVQDISETAARAEGVAGLEEMLATPDGRDAIAGPDSGLQSGMLGNPRLTFEHLWDSIYAKPKRVPAKGPISHYISYPWEDVHETREHKDKPWRVNGNPWVWACEWEPLNIERTEQ